MISFFVTLFNRSNKVVTVLATAGSGFLAAHRCAKGVGRVVGKGVVCGRLFTMVGGRVTVLLAITASFLAVRRRKG